MITSSIWDNIELYNSAKSEAVDLIYKYWPVPRSVNIPEAVVLQFCELY